MTICTWNRECLFGEVVEAKMRLNQGGRIADECWRDIPAHYPYVVLDRYATMPNHVHGIIFISPDDVGVQNFEPLQGGGQRETDTSTSSQNPLVL